MYSHGYYVDTFSKKIKFLESDHCKVLKLFGLEHFKLMTGCSMFVFSNKKFSFVKLH